MDWFRPHWLLALWLIPVIAFLLLSTRRWRRQAAERFAQAPMLDRLAPQANAARQVFKIVLISVALLCLILAIARPRYGTYMQDITTSGTDICILMDVSRSMLADDVQPNRLERAKSDVLDLVDRLQGDRVALIAFAGTSVLKVPLTTDVNFFRKELKTLSVQSTPRGGSMIGDAVLRALRSMESRYDRQQFIVLITDGEDHDSFPEKAAEAAAALDVRIISVGIGDPTDGARIPVQSTSGGLAYQQYNGEEVWSVLREETLKTLADTTGGAYIPARTSVYDLGDIYENHLSAITQSQTDVQQKRRLHERYQLFAGVAFFCLVCEVMLSAFGRQRRDVAGRPAISEPVPGSVAKS